MKKLQRLLIVLLTLLVVAALAPIFSEAAQTGSHADTPLILDNFESYVNTAVLQAAWQFIDNPGIASSLDTTNFYDGGRAMHLQNDKAGPVG